jgi:hypothetical protein
VGVPAGPFQDLVVVRGASHQDALAPVPVDGLERIAAGETDGLGGASRIGTGQGGSDPASDYPSVKSGPVHQRSSFHSAMQRLTSAGG